MPQCAEIHYRTHTRATRFGKPAGFLIPVTNPSCPEVSPVTHTSTLTDPQSRFAIEIVTFAQSGNFINLSCIGPAIPYLRKVGNTGSLPYLTDFTGTAYMCLTSGRCVRSHLVDLQHAPTAQGNTQNYWKYIDVSPHTVEFEHMAGAIGMAAHQDIVKTSLIGGNALRFTTQTGKLHK
jgi:hypothetical protein